jgi:hypothetical protein
MAATESVLVPSLHICTCSVCRDVDGLIEYKEWVEKTAWGAGCG